MRGHARGRVSVPLTQTWVAVVALLGCDFDHRKETPKDSSSSVTQEKPGDSELVSERMARSDDELLANFGPPAVSLSGESLALAVTQVNEGPRIYATELRAWISEAPDPKARRLGYLRAGGSSPTVPQPAGDKGCKGGWFPVKPHGYVCRGSSASLDPNHPIVQAFESHPPRSDQRLPYRYGTVRKPGPMYGRLPRDPEVIEAEPGFAKRMTEWFEAGGDVGAGFRQEVWNFGRPVPEPRAAFTSKLTEGVPDFVGFERNLPSPLGIPRPEGLVVDRMSPKTGHAFLDTFFSEGRRYGLTTHLEVVPTDRYRPLVGSAFHGVEIGEDHELPLAFVRRPGAKYADGSDAAYQEVLALTGKKKFLSKRLHYETKDSKYISDQYASEVTLAEKMPGWALKGERWINISILQQTLVLYEGVKPVYATLVSTGEAGIDDPTHTTATKRGIFRVHTKHVTATMASNEVGEEFELRDVPYVQYFAEGFALHGAYWHDRFGTPKSHGCINLSPEDARRIFYFTQPEVPPGWHGALSPLRGTVVFIHP